MEEKEYWWLSDFNLKPEVMGENHLPKKLKIYDTTLRDGEQTDEVLKKVKELGVKKKGILNDDEFKEIVKEVLKEK